MKSPNIEMQTLAAFVNHAAIDPPGAKKMLDAQSVEPEDFANPHLRAIWVAVSSMVRENRIPDFFAVEHAIGKLVPRQVLVEAMLGNNETQLSPERLKTLRDVGLRRRAGDSLASVGAMVGDTTRPMSEAMTHAMTALEKVRQVDVRAADASTDILALSEHLEKVDQGVAEPVIPTGLAGLDAVIGGYQRTLTIVGSLPGVGKSSLLATLCKNLAVAGVKVGLFSLEDERSWLVTRLVAESAQIPQFILRNRRLTSRQKDAVARACDELFNPLKNVVLDDRPAMNISELVASAREMISRHGIRVLMVDHLGEIRNPRSERHDLDVTEQLQHLRALSKVYGIAVVVACHVKRREGLSQQDAPKLTDFANSSGVERMARVALALSRPQDDTLACHILKQTNGAAGLTVNLRFNGPSGTVGDE